VLPSHLESRNDRLFKNKVVSIEALIGKIEVLSWWWLKARKKG
jgi:hypothetical protein